MPRRYRVKLSNTKYVKGQPGVETLTLEFKAESKGKAQNMALTYVKKSGWEHYVLHKSEFGTDEHPIREEIVDGKRVRVN
jgi:hypothetical protein